MPRYPVRISINVTTDTEIYINMYLKAYENASDFIRYAISAELERRMAVGQEPFKSREAHARIETLDNKISADVAKQRAKKSTPVEYDPDEEILAGKTEAERAAYYKERG